MACGSARDERAGSAERAHRRAGGPHRLPGRHDRDAEPDHHRAVETDRRAGAAGRSPERTIAGNRVALARPRQRTSAALLRMHQAYALSESRFDFAGCVALTGSDAGKVSINPSSSSTWVLRSAFRASFGSAAYLSCAAGSNFLADFPAMNPSICGDNA